MHSHSSRPACLPSLQQLQRTLQALAAHCSSRLRSRQQQQHHHHHQPMGQLENGLGKGSQHRQASYRSKGTAS